MIVAKGKKKMLIVEDDTVSYKLVQELAFPHTDEIVQLTNGLEAVDYFKKEGKEINLIVVDILLPKINGIEVIKSIRKSHPKTPIIGMSASTEANKNNACYKAGCDMFFQKPIDIKSFENTISGYLQKDPKVN